MAAQEISVPDIGDFSDVPIIEIHVSRGRHRGGRRPAADPGERQGHPGRAVAGGGDDHLAGGRRRRHGVRGHGDRAPSRSPAGRRGSAEGAVTSQPADSRGGGSPETATGPREELTAPAGYGSSAGPPTPEQRNGSGGGAPPPTPGTKGDVHAEVLVLGAGPGGYTAAFRAADLGKKVVMVDSRGPLGGVCLNVGCIPSKALLHAAKVIAETKEMSHAGLSFTAPTIDLDALRGWKDGVVTRLTGGLAGLAKQRKVHTLVGTGTFTSPNMLSVTGPDGSTTTVSLRRRDHRRRLRAGRTAVHPARRPPRHRLHRRPGPGQHPRAAAGARRRDHRAGDGHASTPNSAPRSAWSS